MDGVSADKDAIFGQRKLFVLKFGNLSGVMIHAALDYESSRTTGTLTCIPKKGLGKIKNPLVLLCQIRNSFYIGQYPLVVAHVFFGLRLIFRFAC